MTGMAGSDGERMDAIYRWQRHVYDATRKVALLGRDRLIERLRVPDGGSVLEIGCGTGRNLILAAHRYPSARLCGLDVSRVMLATAARAVARAGCAERIRLAEGDATAFSASELFGVAAFDRVFISYALSMMPGWPQAIAAAAGVLAPGGELHIVDFGGQRAWPPPLRRALRAWLARFTVVPCDTLEAELHELAHRTGASLVLERLNHDYAQAAVVRMPLSPEPEGSARAVSSSR